MKNYFFLLFLLGTSFLANTQINQSKINNDVDIYVQAILNRYKIPGAAVAIVKDGVVIHKKNYGHANIEHSVPVSDRSIFRVYSLTKTLIATGVFQLLEQGNISLDDSISKYVVDIPTSWKDIQIKHLLTHSSGLPDMAPSIAFENLSEVEAKEKVFDQKIKFDKGDRYDYNQTNFWLLQQIIEKITGAGIEKFIIENQFDNANEEVFFSSDSRDIIQYRVTPYFPFRNGKQIIDHSHLQGRYLFSANGLNITLDKYLEWNRKFENNELLSKESKAKMFSLFKYQKDKKEFSFGWDRHVLNGHVSYGFSGSLVTAYRIFPKDRLSIIFLSNGLGNYFNIEGVINHIASLVNADIVDRDQYVFENLVMKALKNDFSVVKKYYISLKGNDLFEKVNFESHLNSLGYFCLNNDMKEKAIQIFLLNTEDYQDSWNVWDSLAEGYENLGEKEKAMSNYKKSLNLNPDNTHAIERLKVLVEH